MSRNKHQAALYQKYRHRITIDLAKARGEISQGKLSALTGITKSTISQIETGYQLPRIVQLVAICAALGCTFNDLIKVDAGNGQ